MAIIFISVREKMAIRQAITGLILVEVHGKR